MQYWYAGNLSGRLYLSKLINTWAVRDSSIGKTDGHSPSEGIDSSNDILLQYPLWCDEM